MKYFAFFIVFALIVPFLISDAIAAPVERVPITSFGAYSSDGKEIQEIVAGTQVNLVSNVTNTLDAKQSFVYGTWIAENNGTRTPIDWIETSLDAKSSSVFSISWIPDTAGKYIIEASIWENNETFTAFSAIWQVTLDVIAKDTHEKLVPEPEPEQDSQVYGNCGPGTTLHNGICVVDKTKENPSDSSVRWGGSPYNHDIKSPLKQFKSGVPISEIECKETLLLIKKHDGTPVCVTPETREKLKERGWDAPILVAVNREVSTVHFEPVDISSANNQFAIDFYSNLTQNDSTSNVFFSPTSISTAFSILYEGARQNTSQEIQQVFGFPEEDNLRHSGYLSLHQSINKKSNTDTEISIANALWLAENFEPLAEYIDTATTFYDSTVSTVNFASDEGINRINEWVDDKTQGKITDILKPGSTGSNTKMAITNAIYFKGLWEYPFDPEDTYDSEFMIDKDNSVNVQMMTFPHKMQVNYTSTEKMEMIELPYRNGTVSLLIILPNDIDDLRAVEESITVDNLKMWQDFPTLNRGINIHIPKFTLETEYDLTQQLPDMGMPTVFNPVHADLSGITGYKSLYVSQAIHKAFVEVNEKGTEAAGTTVIVTDESSGQPFRVDHPFVFIIQDNETDNILFMGRVVNPLR